MVFIDLFVSSVLPILCVSVIVVFNTERSEFTQRATIFLIVFFVGFTLCSLCLKNRSHYFFKLCDL